MNNLNKFKLIAEWVYPFHTEVEDLDYVIREEAYNNYSLELGEVELAFIKNLIFYYEFQK